MWRSVIWPFPHYSPVRIHFFFKKKALRQPKFTHNPITTFILGSKSSQNRTVLGWTDTDRIWQPPWVTAKVKMSKTWNYQNISIIFPVMVTPGQPSTGLYLNSTLPPHTHKQTGTELQSNLMDMIWTRGVFNKMTLNEHFLLDTEQANSETWHCSFDSHTDRGITFRH